MRSSNERRRGAELYPALYSGSILPLPLRGDVSGLENCVQGAAVEIGAGSSPDREPQAVVVKAAWAPGLIVPGAKRSSLRGRPRCCVLVLGDSGAASPRAPSSTGSGVVMFKVGRVGPVGLS